MDEPIFDAMLKTALEEALLEDMKELEKEPPVRASQRQRRRMRKMLSDPWGYARRLRAAEQEPPRQRHRNPARWLLVAVITALLAGTAAGYALRGGAFFQQMFESSPWAGEYGSVADTDQLLEMGGGNIGAVLEDEHFRFELLDAVSEGETAMVAVRITVLDMAPLEQAFGERRVAPGHFLRKDGSFFKSGSSGIENRYPDEDSSLAENQFLMILRTDHNRAAGSQRYTISFHDFGYYQFDGRSTETEVVLIPGDWTLEVELSFDGGLVLERGETVQLESCAFTVDRVRIASLSVGMLIHCSWEDTSAVGEALRSAKIRMQDGTEVPYVGFRLSGRGEDEAGFASEVLYEFGMPLEKEQYSSIVIQGQEISLTE